MLFTDPAFLFYFLPVALLLYRFSLRIKGYGLLPQLTLFLATLVFYGFNATWWLYPFIVSIGFDFLWAFLISREERPRVRKFLLILSISQNILLLGIFKYWGFFADLIALYSPPLADSLFSIHVNGTPASLPPGISFYTFESMSFVIDIYRREIQLPQKPMEFFSFIGMFPRFIAGPIVRYKEMAGQFTHFKGMQLEQGLWIFIQGLFLKCCFADSFGVFTKYAFGVTDNLHFLSAWIGVFAYTLQIYFDFSGYSLMAIGLGLCFGFRFPDNFNQPYLATSLQDFWRRWHITLSKWFRDYVYIPLGGNQKGQLRSCLNVFYTMALAGIWHGTRSTLLAWGLWHAFWLCLERFFPSKSQVKTFALVMLGWVFFRASDYAEAFRIFKALFTPHLQNQLPIGLTEYPVSLFFCFLGIIYCFYGESRLRNWNWAMVPVALTLFFMAIGVAFSRFQIPFLYYQF